MRKHKCPHSRSKLVKRDNNPENWKSLSQWAIELGVPYNTLYMRWRSMMLLYCKHNDLDYSDESVRNETVLPPTYAKRILVAPRTGGKTSTERAYTVVDPMEGMTDAEILFLRLRLKRDGISFAKIRKEMRKDPKFSEQLIQSIRDEIVTQGESHA